jgi:RNA polymerase sigma-70 factor (ECF subfamily)
VFAQDGKILKSWEPERGLSLEKFIGLVAERQIVSILRTHKRNPWTEDPTLSDEMDASLPSAMPAETVVASRNAMDKLFETLKEELSPLAWRLFDLVFLQDLSVDEVIAATGMSADAVYAWRSRLSRLARKRYAELGGEALDAAHLGEGVTR